jgi:tetratricopeptide (TPR) repeat protein
MLKQFNRLLLLALIVAGALYITLTNSDTATLKLGPTLTISTYAGVIYIGIFVTGCIFASLIALLFGLKSYLRERRLLSQERDRQSFMKSQEKARDLMAAGDWGAARIMWEQVISRDPENIVARIELSKCVEELGDMRESLRVLDATRTGSRSSIELLFRAADLNHRLGNNTAARDNIELILAHGTSHRALELARECSETLGRYDEALRYQNELESAGNRDETANSTRARLTFGQIMAESQPTDARMGALLALLKRHPEHIPTLEALADIERSRGNVELCAEYRVKAARASQGEISKWRRVVELWLRNESIDQRQRTERAVAAARSATKDTRGKSRLEAELLFIETLLAVNYFQDAERAIENFPNLAQKEAVGLTEDLSQRLLIQKGYCLAQTGNVHSTIPLWQQLAAPPIANGRAQAGNGLAGVSRTEPSPTLSTP